jgi:MFS family permease
MGCPVEHDTGHAHRGDRRLDHDHRAAGDFRGVGLDPLAPGNIGYLLWMILGYLLVSAALVVSLGRLGDMFGRVRMYNLGFVVFSAASLALSVDPFRGPHGAIWLIA